MHKGEYEVTSDLVRRLLAAQFPQWSDLELQPVASAGTDNALFRLGKDMVVRMPIVDWAVADVEKEQEWLPRLAPFLPLPIPTPISMGDPGDGYPYNWSIYRWCEGENPVVGRLANPDSLAKEIAHFINALQSINTAGALLASRGLPLQDRNKSTQKAIVDLQEMMDTVEIAKAWESALDLPIWPGPLVWIHGDLSPGNLLVVDGRLSAVIDFGAMGVGDPACDLIIAWNLLPVGARETFRAQTLVDDATWKRGRGWALSIALIQLPYYFHTNPSLAENARYVISEVLADHRSEAKA